MAEEIHARRGRRILSRPQGLSYARNESVLSEGCGELWDRGPSDSGEGAALADVRALLGVRTSDRSRRLIDLAEGDTQKRDVEQADLVRHDSEEHAFWLEVLGIDEA
jgi:hypothetical protein